MSYEKVKQAKRLSVGLKQTLKAIEQGKAQEVIVAKDADQRLTSRIIQYSEERKIAISYVDSMKQLGKASGIDVGAAAVAVLKD
ncbi:ribosomal protein L7Ae-like protein [Vulcanibacillus modesticaldus]|uniref:RNA-binding protein BHF71_04465 n=1 Tax=Vulcanibacillus modesticaldus TaxID=337097 RepID=A0A1D2YS23_9BACI|nr:50S ribosomal protein L7ae-like protein [Vulcanibacillus modesticaldus]OEF96410.1 ribosomal protein L7Ae-like protein [Vulcanibacillus modesticaldus]